MRTDRFYQLAHNKTESNVDVLCLQSITITKHQIIRFLTNVPKIINFESYLCIGHGEPDD